MFTGLVETMGQVAGITPQSPGCLLRINSGLIAEDVSLGDSICINGCCLTVVGIERDVLDFEAGEETLGRTNLGQLQIGDQVNLERSLRAGDRLGGHYVTGHVDAVARLVDREEDPPWAKLWFQVDPRLLCQMATKGSVTVDGVSLTLVDVLEDRFSVALIPHTLSVTTLGRRGPGDAVNIETDVLAKYVERQLQVRSGWKTDKPSATSPTG
jgi:riboflavin synthase